MSKSKFVSVVLVAGFMLVLALVFSCADYGWDNPRDPKSGKYDPSLLAGTESSSASSSSSEIDSSSSDEGISSSSEVSSSGTEEDVSSSSSDGVSSSSSAGSSSSSDNISSSSSMWECEDEYEPSVAFCYDSVVYNKCNGVIYVPATHICNGISASRALCNGNQYDPRTQRCQGVIVETECGAGWYNALTQYCHTDGVAYSCGNKPYNPTNQGCCNSNVIYSSSTQRCNGNVVETKCGTEDWYNEINQRCGSGDVVEAECGTSGWYNIKEEFCYEGRIVNFCGNNKQEYDPDLYECKSNINENGVYLIGGVTDNAGKNYKAVLIGTQTWMAENLNYNTSGSKCYNNTNNCEQYGKLYNWTEANTNCPTGWHLPSKIEWDALITKAGGSSIAGGKLKAKDGWKNYNDKTGGTDDYGFSALPGGRSINSVFSTIDETGYWWSTTESYQYNYIGVSLNYNSESTSSTFYGYSTQLLSVRCLKNN